MAKTRQQIISRANNKFTQLIKKEIIDKDAIITGDMLRSIDAIFKESKDTVKIQLGAIHYYVYVDEGTRFIKARKITEDVLESKAFIEILEDLMFEWNEIEINDMLFNLGKNKNITVK